MGNRPKNEDGIVAIIVATIIMVILSLLTLGFARLMQNEQRQALDRSLSTQAFYAAESAINEAVSKIQDGTFTANKDRCAQGSTPFTGLVDSSIGSEYTCLLIDQAPASLEYNQSSISTTASKIIPLKAEGGTAINRIAINWDDSAITNPVYSCPSTPVSLPRLDLWPANSPGMLRVDIIPADTLNRQALINDTVSLYLYPAPAAPVSNPCAVASIDYNNHNDSNEKGQLIPVNCQTGYQPRDCDLFIDGLNARQYFIRVRAIYKPSNMSIRIYNNTSPTTPLKIVGVQVKVDATGKASDVLRRIQAHVPAYKSYPVPDFVIQTTDSICKQVSIAPAPTNTVNNSCGL